MKKHSVNFILLLFVFVVLGCSITEQIKNAVQEKPSNTTTTKSNSNNSANDVLTEKTGISECDEVLDIFADQAKAEGDDEITKAAKNFALNRVKQSFKESVEQNKDNSEKMAQVCKDYKEQLKQIAPESKSPNQ